MLELGQEAKDKITGFKGILTTRYQYITGCDAYALTPTVGKDGKHPVVECFDEGRLEIIGKGIKPAKVVGKIKGGPQRDTAASAKR